MSAGSKTNKITKDIEIRHTEEAIENVDIFLENFTSVDLYVAMRYKTATGKCNIHILNIV